MDKSKKGKIWFEIEYLKHLQEHNFFNYNVKFNLFFRTISINSSVVLSVAILFIALYNIPLFNQNININILLWILFVLITYLALFIIFSSNKLKRTVKIIQKNFKSNHEKIKERYQKLGLDLKSLRKNKS